MINRLKWGAPEPDDEEPEVDYWEVNGRHDFYYVSADTAQRLIRQMSRLIPPRRLRFRDLFGADVWIRTSDIVRVSESTTGQRAAERQFWRARREERKADRRPWEDEDGWME